MRVQFTVFKEKKYLVGTVRVVRGLTPIDLQWELLCLNVLWTWSFVMNFESLGV